VTFAASREPSVVIREANMSGQVTIALLKEFLDAFNRHDLDAIMSYFADDCVFYMPRGAGPRGDQFKGKTDVRAGLARRFAGLPDVHYGDDRHWACGDVGVSEWTLTGTSVAGQRVEVRGVDLLEFAHGKIIRKDSFWKIVE
jgi:ketosteroid isomerase-like protein